MTLTIIMIVLILLSVCGVLYYMAFYSPKGAQGDDFAVALGEQADPYMNKIHDMVSRQLTVPYEVVEIRSIDGLKLHARRYALKEDAVVVIAFHGYRGTPVRDFSGGAAIYLERGFNLLMPEQRAHLTSQGHTISFGVNERYDCLSWIEYAKSFYGKNCRIILSGISMGAATVLMAAGLGLPENVIGIMADCPYARPKTVIGGVSEEMHIPSWLSWPFIVLSARLFGGFNINAVDAAKAVKEVKIPILLIHGDEDRLVPCENSYRIKDANPKYIDLQIFPKAGHGISFLLDEKRYRKLCDDFFDNVLHL